MREKLLVMLALVFGGMVVAASVVRINAAEVGVKEEMGEMMEDEAMMEEEVMMEDEAVMEEETVDQGEEVSYYLPYPGILPDHPLYFLKMIRDRAMEWLTFNSVKKAELWLLYADKRIGAAKALVEGNKPDLGVVTAQKAVMYQEKAAALTTELKAKGQEVGDLANRIEQSTSKYEEVLGGLESRVPDQAKGAIEQANERVMKSRGRILEVLDRQ